MGEARQCLEQRKMDEALVMYGLLNQLATKYQDTFLLDSHTAKSNHIIFIIQKKWHKFNILLLNP
jgi:hypothetical protein